MPFSIISHWVQRVLAISLFAAVALTTIALVIVGGVGLFRQRHRRA